MSDPNLETLASPGAGRGNADVAVELAWKMARLHGTPAYVYCATALEDRSRELLGVLPRSAAPRLLYSFKANPLPSLTAELRSAGCEADLTSPGELAAARAAGFDLSRALYGGPGKGVEEYDAAIAGGVRHFSIESRTDLRRLSSAAADRACQVKVLLRINPHAAPKAKLAMSGVASQFGFEEDELRSQGPEILREAGEQVDIVGFHLYWGTQIGEVEALLASFEKTVEIADELTTILGMDLQILNLGGGFAWPYAHAGAAADLAALRDGLERLHAGAGPSRQAQWWFESGRYLAGSSGTLVARVMELKRSKEDRWFLILDTGIHHLGGMAGLGRIPRFSIDLLPQRVVSDGDRITVDVVGPLCTPLDCLAKKLEIPTLEPGDLVAIPNVGAYGATASVVAFLSRPAPVEILHRGGEVIAVHHLRTGHEPLS